MDMQVEFTGLVSDADVDVSVADVGLGVGADGGGLSGRFSFPDS